ncbi:MAG: hypothetical protein FWC23_00190 [Chitinispirillia bacterium]|nr:hypothetical protein [Chitinispirillia bacterium]MCL2267594.1 hypothetical protein [Chitinispirillia bacterium]
MSEKKLMERIFDVIAVCGVVICIALLPPQVRQLLIGICEGVVGRELNTEWWIPNILSNALMLFPVFAVYLLFPAFKFVHLPILREKRPLILSITQITLISLYSGMLVFLAFVSNAIWFDEAVTLAQIQHS